MCHSLGAPLGTTIAQLECIDGLRLDEQRGRDYTYAMTHWKIASAVGGGNVDVFDVLSHIIEKEPLEAMRTSTYAERERQKDLNDSTAMYAKLLQISRGLGNG